MSFNEKKMANPLYEEEEAEEHRDAQFTADSGIFSATTQTIGGLQTRTSLQQDLKSAQFGSTGVSPANEVKKKPYTATISSAGGAQMARELNKAMKQKDGKKVEEGASPGSGIGRGRGDTGVLSRELSESHILQSEAHILGKLKKNLDHLGLLAEALQVKEARELLHEGGGAENGVGGQTPPHLPSTGVVSKGILETVDTILKDSKVLHSLVSKKQKRDPMEKRMRMRDYAAEFRAMRRPLLPHKEVIDGGDVGVEGSPVSEVKHPNLWGPLKYGWQHVIMLTFLFLAVVGSIVLLIVAKPHMAHEDFLMGHYHSVGPGLDYTLHLDHDPLQRVEVELILPEDPATAGGHRRRSRNLLENMPGARSQVPKWKMREMHQYYFQTTGRPWGMTGYRRLLQPTEETTLPPAENPTTDSENLDIDSDNRESDSETHDSNSEHHESGSEHHGTPEGGHEEVHHGVEYSVSVKVEQQLDGVWSALSEGDTVSLRSTARIHHFIFRPEKSNLFHHNSPLRLRVSANWPAAHADHVQASDLLPFGLHLWQYGALGDAQPWIALVVLLTVLGCIALELIHRMLAAMAGSFLMLSLLLLLDKTPNMATVVEFIDEGALALLFGMMILVGKLASTGVFEMVTFKLVGLSRGSTFSLLSILCITTAVLSAFLDNVTTVLLLAPVTVQMCTQLDINPVPFLLSETLFSNIGGTATLIGDPPNIIIGNALSYEIGFVDFIVVLMPGVVVMSPFCLAFLRWFFYKDVVGPLAKYEEVLAMGDSFTIKNQRLLNKSLIVLGGVIVCFLMHPVHHVNPAWIAILGSVALMLVSSGHHVHNDLKVVDWDVLLFFAALFVMVESMGEAGLIRGIGDVLTELIKSIPEDSRVAASLVILIWASALISAFLDNIPYTATMVPVIEQLADAGIGLELAPLAWALAFGACLGGNGSLIGASANIVVAGIAEREGHRISFMAFLRAGFPIMLISIIFATCYMLLLYGM